MKRICFWIGVLCLLYGGLGIVADLLPVDVLGYILELFNERETNTHFKIVPIEGADNAIIIVSFVGMALIAYAKLTLSKKA